MGPKWVPDTKADWATDRQLSGFDVDFEVPDKVF
jgi:hypothetical protein